MLSYKLRRFLGLFFTQDYTKDELDSIMDNALDGYNDPGGVGIENKSYSWGRVYTKFMNAGLKEETARIETDKRFGYSVTMN